MSALRYEAVVIGASTGGVSALRQLFAALPADFALPLITVLHSASESMESLCEVIRRHTALPVREAHPGLVAEPGIWFAAPGYHLLVEADRRFAFSVDERVCYARPSVDVLFGSAADAWRDKLIGVILTGANDDGADGLAALRSRGGFAIVQSSTDAEAPQMPQAALDRAGADAVLPLRDIAHRLIALAAEPQVTIPPQFNGRLLA